MRCDRCQGLLIQDTCYDLLDTDISLRAWRCISCGNVIDDVILKNRLAHAQLQAAALAEKDKDLVKAA